MARRDDRSRVASARPDGGTPDPQDREASFSAKPCKFDVAIAGLDRRTDPRCRGLSLACSIRGHVPNGAATSSKTKNVVWSRAEQPLLSRGLGKREHVMLKRSADGLISFGR